MIHLFPVAMLVMPLAVIGLANVVARYWDDGTK